MVQILDRWELGEHKIADVGGWSKNSMNSFLIFLIPLVERYSSLLSPLSR